MSSPSIVEVSQSTPVSPGITLHHDDPEVASKPLLQSVKTVLHVIDAPFDGAKPRVRAKFSFKDDVAEGQ
jgi:hypothetical protein